MQFDLYQQKYQQYAKVLHDFGYFRKIRRLLLMVGAIVKHHSYKSDLELFLLEQSACVKTKHTLHMKKPIIS